MHIKNIKKLTHFLALSFLCLFILPGIANAAADTSIVVQPSKIEVVAAPGQKVSKSFSIINRSNFYVKFKIIVQDFKQVSQEGALQFFDAKTESAVTWLIPQYIEIGLKPLETKNVGFVVSVPQNFSGGGHYGAILLKPLEGSTNINSNNFGELVLLSVVGTDTKATAIAKTIDFKTPTIQKGNPVDFNFKIENAGNTHFSAAGKLILSNWRGKQIGNYDVGQLIVYPSTSRLFSWRWATTPNVGIYKAEVLLSDNTGKFKLVDGRWFFVFPWQMSLMFLTVALIAWASIKYRQLIFRKLYRLLNNNKRNKKVEVRDLTDSGALFSSATREPLNLDK